MMGRNILVRQQGSVSLVFLFASLALAAVAHIHLMWYTNELRAMEKYMNDTQERLLMDSVFAVNAAQQWDTGQYVWYEPDGDAANK